MYVGKLNQIVNEYNNTYYSTTKRKRVDVKSSIYVDFGMENNENDPIFEVRDHVRIYKYKNSFGKGYVILNWSQDVLRIKKVKNIVPWTYVIEDLNEGEIAGKINQKKLQKTNLKK